MLGLSGTEVCQVQRCLSKARQSIGMAASARTGCTLFKVEVRRFFYRRSYIVACADLHPTKPLLLTSHADGVVRIWDIKTQELVKAVRAGDMAVRAAFFVARTDWVVTGDNNGILRTREYSTLKKIQEFSAHRNPVASIAVHPRHPYLLTAGGKEIKLWNWELGWECTQVFKEHSGDIEKIRMNPPDRSTFASASRDKKIKLWLPNSPTSRYTLEGHQKAVTAIDFYDKVGRFFLVSGSEDKTCKVWDYETQTCIKTLEHTHKIMSVACHPVANIFLTGTADGTINMWETERLTFTSDLNDHLGKPWYIACLKDSDYVAVGYDDGSMIMAVKLKLNLGVDGQINDTVAPSSKLNEIVPKSYV
ncbi:uncharacterized protein [Watersipora subatra]|uniref:uncharacterized protein n=1 Tax=Watersipora subatra TaxID=2589382 RepID=UPI00355C6AA6